MKRKISVFIASPGDLSAERKSFRKAIDQLNVGFGDGADVEFEPLGWEDTLASTGRRSQSVINEEIDRCDVFILAMYRRWGQEAPDAKPYSSYTEEEFHRALERWKKEGTPEIFVFFKRVDAESEADPGAQLKKVMDFRKHLEETRQILYRYFNNEKSFIDEIDHHLRAYAKDDLPKADQQKELVILPLAALEELKKAKELTNQKMSEAEKARDDAEKARLKIEAMQLQAAEDAAFLSKEGKIEFARQKFAELVSETVDIRILYLGYEFYNRTGDLDSALSVLEKWLNLSGPEKITVNTASAYCNLGNLYKTRGDLDRAGEIYQKSLVISEVLGHNEGMANAYGNLGNLYKTRGDLEYAEEMYQKVLAIDESLGRKKSSAKAYSNLGNLYQIRGDLEHAEEMYQKSLPIYKLLGYKQGMATNYGNLGILYKTRGDFEHAEKMYQKALDIEEALGHQVGMANQYGNLGNLYRSRDDLERAGEMYQKTLAIDEELGRKNGMARTYCNLGNLYQTRGDFEHAEEMYQKSLAINEALGCKVGMAATYCNLGILYETQGDLEHAEELYLKALDINEDIKHKAGIAIDYRNLGNLYKGQGDLEHAEEMYQKSLILFKEIKSPNVEVVTKRLKDLRNEISNKTDKKK